MADIKNNEEFKVTDKTIKEDLESIDKNFDGLRERIMQAPLISNSNSLYLCYEHD